MHPVNWEVPTVQRKVAHIKLSQNSVEFSEKVRLESTVIFTERKGIKTILYITKANRLLCLVKS